MCLTCSAVIAELIPLLTSGVIENSCSTSVKLKSHKNHIVNHLRLIIGLPLVRAINPNNNEK